MGQILGAQSLRRKLKRMPDDIKAGVQEAIKDGADVIRFDALRAVPVRSGALAQAIKSMISSDKLGAKIGFWKKGNERMWKLAGWRARFIEFGTKGYEPGETRHEKGSRRKHKIKHHIPAHPAHPFLGPAYRKNKGWVIDRIKTAVNRALERVSNEL
jgi:HK97 gp10 family phage protein